MSDLSISIVTFNENPNRLRMTLKAIKASKYTFSTIVVDNSPIKNPEIEKACQEYAVKFHHTGKNLGFGAAHNLGFSLGEKSPYFLILNPDLSLHEDTIDKSLEYLNQNPGVGMLSPKILHLDGSLQNLMKRNPTFRALLGRFFSPATYLPTVRKQMDLYEMKDVGVDQTVTLGFASGCCMFVRSDLFAKVKGFDDRFFLYFEDADLTRSINEVSKALYCPQITVTHEWRRANRKQWKYILIALNSAYKYFVKWGFKF